MHFGDYTFILVMALMLFGPKKLPEIARQLGKVLAEFRRASNEFKFQIQEELRTMEDEERRKKLAESQALAAASDLAMSEAGVSGRADAGPTILPPSTGEPVSAAKPFAAPVQEPEAEASEAGAAVEAPVPEDPFVERAHGMPAESATANHAEEAPGAGEVAATLDPLNGTAPDTAPDTAPAAESTYHA